VSDQLKYFAERLPATFVYAGIDVEAQGLFAGVRGRQIAGRFTLIASTPFAYGTSEQRTTWRALVSTLETMLRLHQHHPGTLVGMAEYLYRRTSGMIGSLSQLVRGGAILAIEDGTEDDARPADRSRRAAHLSDRARVPNRPDQSQTVNPRPPPHRWLRPLRGLPAPASAQAPPQDRSAPR